MKAHARIRVLLADDHPVALAGLQPLIEAEPNLDCVAAVSDGNVAMEIIRAIKPDVAVLDISMPSLNGITVARLAQGDVPVVKVVMLTLHDDEMHLKQAMQAGARGYVLKRSATDNLLAAIRTVVSGGIYIDPMAAAAVAVGRPSAIAWLQSALAPLRQRELDVLKLTALGFSNKEAALQLDISLRAVEFSKASAMHKLDLKTRVDVVRYAATQGWLEGLTFG